MDYKKRCGSEGDAGVSGERVSVCLKGGPVHRASDRTALSVDEAGFGVQAIFREKKTVSQRKKSEKEKNEVRRLTHRPCSRIEITHTHTHTRGIIPGQLGHI